MIMLAMPLFDNNQYMPSPKSLDCGSTRSHNH